MAHSRWIVGGIVLALLPLQAFALAQLWPPRLCFRPATELVGPATGDLNGDGATDRVMATDGGGNRDLAVALGSPADGLAREIGATVPIPLQAPIDVAVSDLDGDGDPDVVAMSGRAAVVLTNDRGQLRMGTVLEGLLGEARLVLQDFDGDGRSDVFRLGFSTGPRVLWNEGNARLSPGAMFNELAKARPGDVDGDGDPDIVIAYRESVLLLRNEGGRRFTETTIGDLGEGAYGDEVALGDLDGDDDLDVAATGGGGIQLFENKGAGGFERRGAVRRGARSVNQLAIGDMDRDGRTDLVVRHAGGQDVPSREVLVQAIVNRGNWRFLAPQRVFGGVTDLPGDLDGDGRPDLIAGSDGATPYLARNGGAC